MCNCNKKAIIWGKEYQIDCEKINLFKELSKNEEFEYTDYEKSILEMEILQVPEEGSSEREKVPFDMIGKKFDRITVIAVCADLCQIEKVRDKWSWQYICVCECSPGVPFLKKRNALATLKRKNERDGIVKGRCPRCEHARLNLPDLIGMKFNHLTVKRQVPAPHKKNKDNSRYWECYCDCGNPNPLILSSSILLCNKRHSCQRCFLYQGPVNMWEILEIKDIEDEIGQLCKVRCTCCGEEREILSGKLNEKLCEKRRQEDYKKLEELRKNPVIIPFDGLEKHNLIGTKSGKLTIKGYVGKFLNSYYWYCECTCGGISILASTNLIGKCRVKSCGCTNSFGESLIAVFLSKHNIQFIRQKQFNGFIGERGKQFRFDFLIYYPNSEKWFLCEYQGKQHYEPVKFHSKWTQEQAELNFQKNQLRDQKKKDYCQEHNYDLLEIPYWEYDNIKKILADKLGIELSEEELNNVDDELNESTE